MKNYLLTLWNTLDPVYYNFTRLHNVADHDRNKTIFRVRLTKYKGSFVILEDGTAIRKNDVLLKIHLHNVRMIRELKNCKSQVQRALVLYRMVRNDLQHLSSYIEGHPRCHDIKAIIGITMLDKGTRRLGFEAFAIKNRYYRLFKQLTCAFINFIAGRADRTPPCYLFMSTNRLLNHSERTS
ncbi:YkoP family protein [Lentibacillus cibarius]|uniref:YkoP-like domain-containing protein n=1 Tax=Lentibacillus cibarius TaxID=2583219 RepID=A0A5S3QLB4_9BACI|nr:hypothetical protein [Lentibacillus cibarius]TMN22650.1 hypothetical protein FFL34_11495 [Lentibacillus cibarius]